ncbi:tumor necrosis factor alpha-induced protein 2 [Suricata suricatta]|uniref:tumor necrosis factor alpha-induced protein 2 n=1 Tax=Suricata suricatta TaxID=37032 RepID=UPI001155C987|nr:tumor necrosis factor alpha-induced protein 2 [Suricata suricatta]
MLKIMTFFQGLPGQQTVRGVLDLPGSSQKLPSTSEAESEASMSEASSEDLVPPPEAKGAPDTDEVEATKKKKKRPKGLANMFSVFTKGRKKKGQPSPAAPEGQPESQPELSGPLPTVEELKADLERGRLEAARPLLLLERELRAAGTRGLRLRSRDGQGDRVLGLPETEAAKVGSCAGGAAEGVRASSRQPPCACSDIINSPKLAGELQRLRLGSLLPPRQIRLLEATFLSNEMASVKELTARALDLECQRWTRDVAPQRLDSHCHSELAIDIIQILSQSQAKAESITLDLGTQIKQVLLAELATFLRSYQRTFDEFLERGKQLRNYRANVIANINNCLSFRTAMQQRWQTQDLPGHLLAPLSELKSHGFDTLLQSLFGGLKPLFKRFTQTRWAAPAQTLEEIIAAVGERLPEFSALQDCFREELMEAVHLHLVKEYIVRLSKRSLVLKTSEQQQQLAGHIQASADLIQRFCTQNGSPAAWLHHALPKLAEIIRLQDPSAIKIEVATYATWYPDFSKGHLSAILAIKGNLSSSEVKSIRSILDVSTGTHEPFKSLFSLIKVG